MKTYLFYSKDGIDFYKTETLDIEKAIYELGKGIYIFANIDEYEMDSLMYEPSAAYYVDENGIHILEDNGKNLYPYVSSENYHELAGGAIVSGNLKISYRFYDTPNECFGNIIKKEDIEHPAPEIVTPLSAMKQAVEETFKETKPT